MTSNHKTRNYTNNIPHKGISFEGFQANINMPLSDWLLDKTQLENVDSALQGFDTITNKFIEWGELLVKQTIPILEDAAKNISFLSQNVSILSHSIDYQASHLNETCNTIVSPFYSIAQNLTSSIHESLTKLDHLSLTMDHSVSILTKQLINSIDQLFFCIYLALGLFSIIVVTYVYSNCCTTQNNRDKFKYD